MNDIENIKLILSLIKATKKGEIKWEVKFFKYYNSEITPTSLIYSTIYNNKNYILYKYKKDLDSNSNINESQNHVILSIVNKDESEETVFQFNNSINDLFKIVNNIVRFQHNQKNYRVRALDDLKQNHNLNFITKHVIPSMDRVFNKGNIGIDYNYYIKRENNFEEFFVSKVLSLERKTSDRITCDYSFLVGTVGTGKTTFISYILDKIIIPEYVNVFPFYLDFHLIPKENHYELIKERIVKTIVNDIVNKYFENSEFEFMNDFVNNHLKCNEYLKSEIISIYKNLISVESILTYIDRTLSINKNLTKLLLIFDNIDENSKEVLNSIFYFQNYITNFAHSNFKYISFTILVVCRNYSMKAFNTRNVEATYIRPVETNSVIKSKLIEFKESIEFSGEKIFEKINSDKQGLEKTIIISKNFLEKMLENIIDYIFIYDESETISLLQNISSDNLKLLVANMFNLLNSSKLPFLRLIIEIFENYDFDNDKLIYQIENRKLLTFDSTFECLVAIYHPYYNVETSLVLNVFNLNNSRTIDDFQNILAIPRLLFLIKNLGQLTFNLIIAEFNDYNYSNNLIKIAFEKCFEKGLFKTECGVCVDDIDKNIDKIELSSSGNLYINKLISSFIYLQYMCEDTPLESEFLVDIKRKYPVNNSIGELKIRKDSVFKFVEFLIIQEHLELKSIRNKNKDIQNYLDKFSINVNGNGIMLTSFIKEKALSEMKEVKK